MKSWLPRLRPIASTKRSSTRLFNIQRAISIWLLTLARRANDRCRRNGNRKICATHPLLTHAAESERPSAGFRDSHRAVAAATAPRVAVLSLGAEPVLSEAEGGHPCRGNERAIRRTCGRRKNYAVNMLRALFSGASRMIPAFFPTYRFTETPRSALRA